MKNFAIYLAVLSLAILCGCSNNNGWKITGHVEGASQDDKIALEGFNGAQWYGIDTLAVGRSGDFSYASETPTPNPDIYRITLNGKTIYFPIDSIETITIKANAANFDTDYTLEGSQNATSMMDIDRMLSKSIASKGIDATINDSIIKRELNNIILADSIGLISYYVINKTYGDKPLYNPAVRKDLNMIGAIANKFNVFFPNDPRTNYLKKRFLDARKSSGFSTPQVIEAPTLGIIEISLFNPKGEQKSLKEVASNANVTLLNLTSFDMENAAAYNTMLYQIFSKFKDQNLAIYQVSFDDDEVNWMKAAANLPWVAVHAMPSDATILQSYNVAAIPVTFIIDRNSDIVERVEDPSKLESLIRKHL